LWHTALAERLAKVSQSAVLRNLAAEIWKTGPTPNVPKQVRILKSVGTAAQRALRRIHRDAAKEREKFLHERKSRLAQRMSSKDTDVEVAIKNIKRQLKDAKVFQRIARAIKPQTSAPLTNVELISTTSHLHPITGKIVENFTKKGVDTRQALETAIIARNKDHFAQANGTPFSRYPLSQIGRSNGYDVFKNATRKDIRLPDTAFLETATILDIPREGQREPGPEWSDVVSFNDFILGLLN
jgi:hypothetical protein